MNRARLPLAICSAMAISFQPVYAADAGGNGSCYYNDIGGACSDLEGNGWWSECESGYGSGTKSEKWAEGHCGGGWHAS